MEGPKGTVFSAHVEGLTQFIGMDLMLQLFDTSSGSGLALNSAGPVHITGDVVDLHPSIPFGGIYEFKKYDVGYLIYDPYPTHYVTQNHFATFTIKITVGNTLEGSVGELVSGLPIPDATVTLNGKTTKTLVNGSFKITGISNGTYTMSISKSGYTSYSESGMVFQGDTQLDRGWVFLEGPPPTCAEGETRCAGPDLYKCVGGGWELFEQNSATCTVIPPISSLTGLALLALPIVVAVGSLLSQD